MSFDETREPTDPPPLRQWVDAKTVRDHLGGVSANTMTDYIRAGLPAHQIIPGGRYLFDLAEVDQWIYSRWSERAAGQTADRAVS